MKPETKAVRAFSRRLKTRLLRLANGNAIWSMEERSKAQKCKKGGVRYRDHMELSDYAENRRSCFELTALIVANETRNYFETLKGTKK